MKNKNRCEWAQQEDLISYHDREWGVPSHDDRSLFEMLSLEGAQAGLSWNTILKRRKGYKRIFHNFNVKKVIKMTDKEIEEALKDEGIIRNKAKVLSIINNAKAFIKIQEEFGSFDKFIWNFVNGKQVKNKYKSIKEIPAKTELSEKISKDLKQRGMSFVGSTIICAYIQAIGIVNDHEVSCFRYNEIK